RHPKGSAMSYGPDIRRVVLVVLDGVRADAVPKLGLRCWHQLANLGASSLRCQTVAPSVTAAAMASLLTGVRPAVRGLRGDRSHLPRCQETLRPLPRALARAGLPTSGFVRRLPWTLRGVGRRLARHLGVEVARFVGRGSREILFAAWEQLAAQ